MSDESPFPGIELKKGEEVDAEPKKKGDADAHKHHHRKEKKHEKKEDNEENLASPRKEKAKAKLKAAEGTSDSSEGAFPGVHFHDERSETEKAAIRAKKEKERKEKARKEKELLEKEKEARKSPPAPASPRTYEDVGKEAAMLKLQLHKLEEEKNKGVSVKGWMSVSKGGKKFKRHFYQLAAEEKKLREFKAEWDKTPITTLDMENTTNAYKCIIEAMPAAIGWEMVTRKGKYTFISEDEEARTQWLREIRAVAGLEDPGDDESAEAIAKKKSFISPRLKFLKSPRDKKEKKEEEAEKPASTSDEEKPEKKPKSPRSPRSPRGEGKQSKRSSKPREKKHHSKSPTKKRSASDDEHSDSE